MDIPEDVKKIEELKAVLIKLTTGSQQASVHHYRVQLGDLLNYLSTSQSEIKELKEEVARLRGLLGEDTVNPYLLTGEELLRTEQKIKSK